jgi:hypothetical protein
LVKFVLVAFTPTRPTYDASTPSPGARWQ